MRYWPRVGVRITARTELSRLSLVGIFSQLLTPSLWIVENRDARSQNWNRFLNDCTLESESEIRTWNRAPLVENNKIDPHIILAVHVHFITTDYPVCANSLREGPLIRALFVIQTTFKFRWVGDLEIRGRSNWSMKKKRTPLK